MFFLSIRSHTSIGGTGYSPVEPAHQYIDFMNIIHRRLLYVKHTLKCLKHWHSRYKKTFWRKNPQIFEKKKFFFWDLKIFFSFFFRDLKKKNFFLNFFFFFEIWKKKIFFLNFFFFLKICGNLWICILKHFFYHSLIKINTFSHVNHHFLIKTHTATICWKLLKY